jgi:hypothetical protein
MGVAYRQNKIQAKGELAFGAVTAGYVTLLALGTVGRVVILSFANSLSGDVTISLDGGTTDYITLPAGLSHQIPFGMAGIEYSGTVSVKQGPSGASTSGIISCGAIRAT